MYSAFDSYASFAMNQFPNPLPKTQLAPPPRFPGAQPAGWQSPAPFDGGSMSSSNYGYSSQQMSRGPGGFSRTAMSASGMSYDRHAPGEDATSWYNEFSYYSSQSRGGGDYGFNRNSQYFDSRSFGSLNSWSSGQGGFDNYSFGYSSQGFGSRSFGNPNACQRGENWSDTGVKDGKLSIDQGLYKLDFDKSNSSMTMTDKKTGIATKLWGDPHITLNAGTNSSTSGMFNGPMTFELPDHTSVAVATTPAKSGNVSYSSKVTITRGNQAYVVSGLNQEDSAPLNVQRSRDGFSLSNQTSADAVHLTSAAGGTGWINDQTHQAVAASDFHA